MAIIYSYPTATPKVSDLLVISNGSKKTKSASISSIIDLINTGLLPGTGTVTSVGVSMPSAFAVSNSPVTSAGVINVTVAGAVTQFIDGTGVLQSNRFEFNTTSVSGIQSAGNTASGALSTAMGNGATASGVGSTARGLNTTSSGVYSAAMGGISTIASGSYSTVMGINTRASDYASLVFGQHNLSGSTATNATAFDLLNTAFVIGNGTNGNNRADAFKVLFNGNTTATGTFTASSIIKSGGTSSQYLMADGSVSTTPFKGIGIGVNSENDSTVTGSLLTGGTNSYPNKLGINNTKPIDEPVSYTRSNDTNYISGSASVATISAGYDNVNNAIAGIIESQHSMLYYGAGHSSIHGGSLHTIEKDAAYSTIVSGTDHVIEELCSYAAIIGGERCKILTGADIVSSGFRSVILGSLLSQVSNRNGLILGGENVNIQAKYASSINSFNSTIYNGIHTLAVGNTIKIGENTVSNYSTAMGSSIEINSSYSHAKGNGHIIDNIFVNAVGESCKSSFNGANLESSRQRGNVAGNNMALRWSASQETTDTTTARLSTYGSSGYPKQPDNTIVTGTVHVTGVDDSGECSTYIIDFTTQKIGTSNPVLKASTVSTIYDGLSLPTAPTINTTSSGIYRVQVVGLAATNIRWEASFNGHQIVFN